MFLSNGVLAPIELIRRALGHRLRVMAITDHVGPGSVEFILNALKKECHVSQPPLGYPGPTRCGDHSLSERRDRRTRSRGQGHGRQGGVHGETVTEPLVLDSDAHQPGDLLTRNFAMRVARGAGLSDEDATALLGDSPRDLLARLDVTLGR